MIKNPLFTMKNHYDFLGLSTESKPETNLKDGSTFFEVDTSKLFIFYQNTWYEQE